MNSPVLPHVISFYAGEKYYFDAADALKSDCRSLGIPHSIVELPVEEGFDWGRICRKKIEFYRDQMEALDGPVLWVDVDSRILKAPTVLAGCGFDMAGYARHNRYIRDYDKYYSSRFWMPQVLYFNNTDRTKRFLDYLAKIESASAISGSDDYFMQEAWASFPEAMSVGFMPPQTLAMTETEINDETIVCFRSSGNVSQFVKSMEQHTPPYKTAYFRKKVFETAAADAQLTGDRIEAALLLQRAFMIDKSDPVAAMKLAEVLRANGRFDEAIEVLETHQLEVPGDHSATKKIVNYQLARGELEQAATHLESLSTSDVAGSKEFAASRMFRLDLERRALAMGVGKGSRPGLWWMESPYPGNFGDVLNPYLVEKVSGLPPRFTPRGVGLLAIGSVIKFAKAGTSVWGTGTPRMTDALSPDADYAAVRGPLTRRLVIESGGSCPEVMGDPALLLPRFYSPSKPKTYKLGLIPHVCHLSVDFNAPEDVLVISPALVGYAAIEQFIDDIASCDSILTSSLHGLIVANAYGVPARWCHFGLDAPALAGDGTKFHDYFLSVGMPIQEPLDLSQFGRLDTSLARHVDRELELRFDAEKLLAAYPGPRAPWVRGEQATTPTAAELANTDWRQLLGWARNASDESTHAVIADSLHRRVAENPSSLRIFLKEMVARGQLDLIHQFSRTTATGRRAALLREATLLAERGEAAAAKVVFEALNGE